MRGFTIIELVVAMALLLAITAGVFGAIQASPDAALVQSETADMQQRVRVAVEGFLRDAIGATGVHPCRWGGPSEDPPDTFRADAATLVSTAGTKTYWLKTVEATGTFQLTSWAGGTSPDVPVVDHVVALSFAYYGDGPAPLVTADLPGVRSIAVTIRVQAAVAALRGPAGALFAHAGTAHSARRWAPDLEVHLRVAPRNLNLDR
jgi:prepilin-type N-terminal cleavage/methylation domain-containing protein